MTTQNKSHWSRILKGTGTGGDEVEDEGRRRMQARVDGKGERRDGFVDDWSISKQAWDEWESLSIRRQLLGRAARRTNARPHARVAKIDSELYAFRLQSPRSKSPPWNYSKASMLRSMWVISSQLEEAQRWIDIVVVVFCWVDTVLWHFYGLVHQK